MGAAIDVVLFRIPSAINEYMLKYGLLFLVFCCHMGCATIENDWERACQSDTVYGYQVFIKSHPESEYVSQAQRKLNALSSCEELQQLIKSDGINNLEQIKLLINQGANVNRCNENGITALWRVAAKGQTEIVDFLIKANADVNLVSDVDEPIKLRIPMDIFRDITNMSETNVTGASTLKVSGASPLWIASWNGHTDSVKLLLEAKADIYKTAQIITVTPKTIFSDDGQYRNMRLWVERKVLFDEFSALQAASTQLHKDIVALLKRYAED